MYRAITLFTDLQDNGHKYMPGDTYPRHGLKPTKDRINELLTDKNRRHKPMIEEVEEQTPVEQPVEAETVVVDVPETEQPVEKPKPKKKRAKKAPEGE